MVDTILAAYTAVVLKVEIREPAADDRAGGSVQPDSVRPARRFPELDDLRSRAEIGTGMTLLLGAIVLTESRIGSMLGA